MMTAIAMASSSSALAQQIWIWFDEDGTPVFSDRHDHADAEPYRLGTFDEVALRQQNTPHRGLGAGGGVPAGVPADVAAIAVAAAKKHGVDPHLVLAVIGIESGYRQSARSRVGATGLMQLMPDTAADLGVDATIAAENVDGGTRYLAWLLRHFKSERLALAGYNAGPGRVKRAGNQVPKIGETQHYVRAVLALRESHRRAERSR